MTLQTIMLISIQHCKLQKIYKSRGFINKFHDKFNNSNVMFLRDYMGL